MVNFRQGDVLILDNAWLEAHKEIEVRPTSKDMTKVLPDLKLALGEVTGHSHQITTGNAKLFGDVIGAKFLEIAEPSTLTHEEHHAFVIPVAEKGYTTIIQREYTPEGWKFTAD
jgi:hypothetical protein